jgi:hypothetical protein
LRDLNYSALQFGSFFLWPLDAVAERTRVPIGGWSPPLAKTQFWAFPGLTPVFWHFNSRKRDKKKGHKNYSTQKGARIAFCACSLAQKKKDGVGGWVLAALGESCPGYFGICLVWPSLPICQRNTTTFQALRTPFRPFVFVGFISDPGQPSPDVGIVPFN